MSVTWRSWWWTSSDYTVTAASSLWSSQAAVPCMKYSPWIGSHIQKNSLYSNVLALHSSTSSVFFFAFHSNCKITVAQRSLTSRTCSRLRHSTGWQLKRSKSVRYGVDQILCGYIWSLIQWQYSRDFRISGFILLGIASMDAQTVIL